MKMLQNKKYVFISIVISILVISLFSILLYKNKKNYKPINIILIIVDALRPDHLSCYGYKKNTSPNIDRLANEGVKFTQAISAGGWTVESVPSILTGTYSLAHQIRSLDDLRNPKIKTLGQELVMKGYQCVLWSNLSTLSHLDIKDGFQKIYVSTNYKNNMPVLTNYALTSRIVNRLKIQYKNCPFFFYIHYEGCHVPYRPPVPYKYMYLYDKDRKESINIPISKLNYGDGKYDGRGKIPYVAVENNIADPDYYISQYDGAISYTDAQVGRLMDGLKELGLDENTLVILTADHGEMLGEHDVFFSHYGSYEENIRVPLIIRFPETSQFPRGRVISRQVSLIDIAPTILELLGLNKPFYIQGESLLAFIKPFRTYHKKYIFSCDKGCFALRTENWKLISNNPQDLELYNLKEDPLEQYNLVTERSDKFKQLKQKLYNFMKRNPALLEARKGHSLTEEDKKLFRSLGYIQ